MDLARTEFEAGREAALAGDFACAHERFDAAVELVRPAGASPSSDPEMQAFSQDLYDGILRYEALAAPPAETLAAEGTVAPELAAIEAPSATEEAMSSARAAIATDASAFTFDIPIVVNDAVLKILATFQGGLHDIIARGLARSGRYVPMIHRIFEEERIPKDLAQVALIESSFLPRARSPKAAHGIWQFMLRTGRQYGLAANGVVDERSDPEKATRAAARHLSYLHELFHDWYLALAAYNAGEGKILRAEERTGLTDFWQLAASGMLREQTQNYVPAVIAATLIAKNPQHYGFEVEYEPALAYDVVQLDRSVRLQDLAVEQGASLEDLQQLNPELRAAVTPKQPEGYALKIPVGTRDAVLAAFEAAPTAKLIPLRKHVVRRGETLATVARRFHVSAATLAAENGLAARSKISRGEVLIIPQPARLARRSLSKAAGARAAAGQSYRVRGGDTLYGIARAHGTTVAVLMAANRLESPEIKPGDTLRIPGSR